MSRMFNLKELLEGKQSVALGGHVRPDGDCVGSTMGLYLYLKENFPQIETDLYLESVPEAYSMIRHTDEVKSELPEGKIYDLHLYGLWGSAASWIFPEIIHRIKADCVH